MRFINWLKIQFLRYERHHARYMQAFLRAEMEHKGVAAHLFDWYMRANEINTWEAQEALIVKRINELRGK